MEQNTDQEKVTLMRVLNIVFTWAQMKHLDQYPSREIMYHFSDDERLEDLEEEEEPQSPADLDRWISQHQDEVEMDTFLEVLKIVCAWVRVKRWVERRGSLTICYLSDDEGLWDVEE